MHAFPFTEFALANHVHGIVVPPAPAANPRRVFIEAAVYIMHSCTDRRDIGAVCVEKIDAFYSLTVQAVDDVLDQRHQCPAANRYCSREAQIELCGCVRDHRCDKNIAACAGLPRDRLRAQRVTADKAHRAVLFDRADRNHHARFFGKQRRNFRACQCQQVHASVNRKARMHLKNATLLTNAVPSETISIEYPSIISLLKT